jgi:cobalt/nickel transport system permease protein
LAFSLLGTPFAVLSMAIVLAVQSIFFGDGGLNALGANILNMALIGTGMIGFVMKAFFKSESQKVAKLLAASWVSVMLAAFACSAEVAIAGAVSFSKVLPAMLSTHALIGLGEGMLTAVLVCGIFSSRWFLRMNEQIVAASTFILAVVAASLSPFASNFPDGLEWVAGKLSFAQFQGLEISAFFPDYQVTFLGDGALATVAAGMVGLALVSLSSLAVGQLLSIGKKRF